ncbi:MAG: hypothetical protein EON90_09575 [Brevundimonas sp.]|nr:MAG: hypothetical protein EON90_09575 [Brevundimonas sp.]
MILTPLLALAGLFQTPAPDVASDPLAPARAGLLQCYAAAIDIDRKICAGISTYTFNADGSITTTSVNVMNDDPVILLGAASVVYVRDGAECSRIADHADHFTTIDVDGVRLEGEDLAMARRNLADIITATLGNGEYCTRYTRKADGGIEAVTSVNGVEKPETRSQVLWIRPEDGWRAVPLSSPST